MEFQRSLVQEIHKHVPEVTVLPETLTSMVPSYVLCFINEPEENNLIIKNKNSNLCSTVFPKKNYDLKDSFPELFFTSEKINLKKIESNIFIKTNDFDLLVNSIREANIRLTKFIK